MLAGLRGPSDSESVDRHTLDTFVSAVLLLVPLELAADEKGLRPAELVSPP